MTTTLITGANRSLGLETTRRLIDAGHSVYAGMREIANGDAARELGAHVVQLDVTDATSIVRVTQAALPLLRRSSNPVIVNVASGVGWPRYLVDETHDEFPVKAVPYAASKAAVVALTVQYAKNLPHVRVNASDPGYTATDVNRHGGHQTVTEGTDATVALATAGKDGPTGEFHDRSGRIEL